MATITVEEKMDVFYNERVAKERVMLAEEISKLEQKNIFTLPLYTCLYEENKRWLKSLGCNIETEFTPFSGGYRTVVSWVKNSVH